MNTIFKIYIILFLIVTFIGTGYAQNSHTVIVGDGGSFSFSPTNLNISSGDTVIWEWQANNHSTTSDAITGPEVWDSGIQNNGATYSKVFIETGIYPYHCTPHQSFGMVGTITVETALEVNDFENGKVESFLLGQNFPNPFNPKTSIQFSLPQESNISINVYDIIGNKIKSLVNSVYQEGEYSIDWDSTNNLGIPVPSGTYIYSLIANNQTQTMKMILLR